MFKYRSARTTRASLLGGLVVFGAAGTVLVFGQGGGVIGEEGRGAAQFQPIAQRLKPLNKIGVQLPILKKPDFQLNFGGNPEIPRTGAALRALSKKVFTPEGRAQLDECSEYEVGLVMAGMMNPDISDEDRDAVDGDAGFGMPTFNKTYTSGHFKFYYTDNNANAKHNSTLANIQATATVMNNAWNDFAANWKEPKHYVSGGKKMIDVKCYDLGDSLYGVTNSSWNHIELNSNKVIKSSTKRQTTPVHELFHRLQYAYGYITGTANMKWAVEATASWSQKYRAPSIGDWMDRINAGLNSPDQSLTSRSYDVCGMWCYLGQRSSGGNERNFVRGVWSTYSTNGKNMLAALETNIKSRIGASYNTDTLMSWWNFTNFYKDMSNASASFDYKEDELTTPSGYGPLGTVPRTTKALAKGATVVTAGSAQKYGADYHVWTLGAGITKVEIKITVANAAHKFGYALVKYKGSTQAGYRRTPAGGHGTYTFTETINLASADRVALAVIGNPNGGSYSISAKGL